MQGMKFFKPVDSVIAGVDATVQTGDIISASGYARMRFLVALGAVADTAVVTVKIQQGNASDLSDAVDIASSELTITASSAEFANKLLSVDALITKKYCRVAYQRTVANTAIDSVVGIAYSGRYSPRGLTGDLAAESFVAG